MKDLFHPPAPDPMAVQMTGRDMQDMRRQLGWTQIELARQLGTSQDYVSDWENGISRKTGQPCLITRRVALALCALRQLPDTRLPL